MVDDGDLRYIVGNLGRLGNDKVVGIHDDQKRCRADQIQTRIAVDEHIGIFLISSQAGGEDAEHIALTVDDNLGTDAAEHTQTGNADTGTDRVKVGIAMTHDQHIPRLCDAGAKLCRADAGAHLGALLGRFGSAAVIFHAA